MGDRKNEPESDTGEKTFTVREALDKLLEQEDAARAPAPIRYNSRRPHQRSKTIAPRRLTPDEIKMRELFPVLDDLDRPKERGDCVKGMRPCPYVTCKHHLYLDVNPETGSIKLNFPDLEIDEMAETCSLDVADRGGMTLEEVGEILNLTRERARQVELRGLLKMKFGPVEGGPATAEEADNRDAGSSPIAWFGDV